MKHYYSMLLMSILCICSSLSAKEKKTIQLSWVQKEIIPQEFAQKYRTALVLTIKKLQTKIEQLKKEDPQGNDKLIHHLEEKVQNLRTILAKASTNSQERIEFFGI